MLIGRPHHRHELTLLTGRAHEKHTEGGDFRQATYRAIRQGLMTALVEGDFSRHDLFDEDAAEDVAEDAAVADAKQPGRTNRSRRTAAPSLRGARDPGWCRVLEPWYRFRLDIPQDMLGRAMSDIQRMSGTFDPPEMDGQFAVLAGVCPVSEMRDYAMDVNVYTHGTGHLGACSTATGHATMRPRSSNKRDTIRETISKTPLIQCSARMAPVTRSMVPGAGFHASGSRIRRRAVTSSPGKGVRRQ